MFTAWSPFGPAVTSKDTFWLSFRVLKPLPWIAEKWANRSLPPPSGVMKPKPLESLNHLTVPVLICAFPKKLKEGSRPERGNFKGRIRRRPDVDGRRAKRAQLDQTISRSEERRVGKECRSRWSADQ